MIIIKETRPIINPSNRKSFIYNKIINYNNNNNNNNNIVKLHASDINPRFTIGIVPIKIASKALGEGSSPPP
jgi:hypothetical protein